MGQIDEEQKSITTNKSEPTPLKAETLSFTISSDINNKIEEIVREHHLTKAELCDHISTQKTAPISYPEVENALKILLKNGEIIETLIEGELILKSIKMLDIETKNWLTIDRSMSKNWLKNRSFLDLFFSKNSKVFNKAFRFDSFNQTYDPLPTPMDVQLKEKKYALFTSNDYLGLSKHPDIIKACKDCLDQYGHGSGGSRILSGTTSVHTALEKKIAEFKHTEDAIVFSSGFMTNLALFSILRKETLIFFDSLCHTSIIEGIKLSKAPAIRFKHNNIADLESALKENKDSKYKLIIVEGVYSMDGDISPMKEIVQLSKKFNAHLAVDEAHSSGTIGNTGRGVSEYFNLNAEDIDFKIGTLGKAFGAEGGYIAGSRHIIELMKYTSNPYLFSTSLPANTMAGTLKAIEILEKTPSLVKRLQENSSKIRSALENLGFNIGLSETHIIPVIIPDEAKLIAFQHELKKQEILVNIVIFPAVPMKESRLRISVSAEHTETQINTLLSAFKSLGQKYELIK